MCNAGQFSNASYANLDQSNVMAVSLSGSCLDPEQTCIMYRSVLNNNAKTVGVNKPSSVIFEINMTRYSRMHSLCCLRGLQSGRMIVLHYNTLYINCSFNV